MFAEQELDSVFDLEKELLTAEVRQNRLRLEGLLESDFFEFTAAGEILTRTAAVERMLTESAREVEPFDFDAIFLSADIVHVTFKTRAGRDFVTRVISLHSSLWERNDSGWQLLFRQETPVLPKNFLL